MARQCNVEQNKQRCACTYTSCNKTGICCECIVYHKNRGELPGCLFPASAEKTYDRSIAHFVRLHSK